MTKVMYKAEIFAEGGRYVGLCRELDVSSFGDTPEEASSSLQEAVEAYLEGCENLGTLGYVMVDSGFEKKNDVWRLRERIVEEKVATIQENTRRSKKRKRILGLHPGSMRMSDDFDAPLPDEFWFGKS